MNRGSVGGTCRVLSRHGGFNEAPIHESGKCIRIGHRTEEANAASMRPRFMNRGSNFVKRVEKLVLELQ